MKLFLCNDPKYKGNLLLVGTDREMNNCMNALMREYNYYLMCGNHTRQNYKAIQIITYRFGGNNSGLILGMENKPDYSEWQLLSDSNSLTNTIHKVRAYGHA